MNNSLALKMEWNKISLAAEAIKLMDGIISIRGYGFLTDQILQTFAGLRGKILSTMRNKIYCNNELTISEMQRENLIYRLWKYSNTQTLYEALKISFLDTYSHKEIVQILGIIDKEKDNDYSAQVLGIVLNDLILSQKFERLKLVMMYIADTNSDYIKNLLIKLINKNKIKLDFSKSPLKDQFYFIKLLSEIRNLPLSSSYEDRLIKTLLASNNNDAITISKISYRIQYAYHKKLVEKIKQLYTSEIVQSYGIAIIKDNPDIDMDTLAQFCQNYKQSLSESYHRVEGERIAFKPKEKKVNISYKEVFRKTTSSSNTWFDFSNYVNNFINPKSPVEKEILEATELEYRMYSNRRTFPKQYVKKNLQNQSFTRFALHSLIKNRSMTIQKKSEFLQFLLMQKNFPLDLLDILLNNSKQSTQVKIKKIVNMKAELES